VSAESAATFVKDTAAKTKQSARTIAEDVQIARGCQEDCVNGNNQLNLL
jgi:hypothetical protein